MARLGLRFRRPWTLRQYTIVATALSEGYAMRQHIEGGLEPFTRATGADGRSPQEWTLFGAAMEALVMQAVELDPDFRPNLGGAGPDGSAAGPDAAGRWP